MGDMFMQRTPETAVKENRMMRCGVIFLSLLLMASKADSWRRRRRSPPPPPPPDTTPPTLHGCPSNLGNQYTPTSTARVTWSEPTCSDSGSSCTVTRTGAAPGSYFPEGSHTITYRASDAAGNTRTCSFSFTVVVIRCSSLGAPSNGRVSCSNGRSVGSVCQSSCNTGYSRSGSASRTCVQSGNSAYWSGSSVSCTRITCSPALPSPTNGAISCTDSSYYNSVCSYTCHAGYTLISGSSQRTCTSSGWSGATAQCQDVTPPTFTHCPASQNVFAPALQTSAVVHWTEPGVSDTTGQSVTSTRTSGPAPGSSFSEGITSITYDAADMAGNQAVTCAFSISVEVIHCSTISGTQQLLATCPDGTIRGSVCTFTCNTGYELVGSETSECRLTGGSGTWSHATPSCQLLQCPSVSAPPNGSILGTCSTGYSSSCRFTCDEGYVINNDEITCSAQPGSSSAYWEGSLPHCTIINCTKHTLTSGLQLPLSPSCPSGSEVPYGSHCTYACSQGYYMQGDQSSSCLSDGSWDLPAPSCHALNCSSLDIPAPSNGIKTGCPNSVETYGTVCTFSCNVGYLPDTPVYRTCEDDGTGSGIWDGGPVTCAIVMCPALPHPNNGAVTECFYDGVPNDIGSEQKYSTVCSLSCNTGFTRMSGSVSRTCTASGTWDGTSTVCEDITPPVLICALDREIVAEERTIYGTVPWHEWEPLMATDAGSEIEAHLTSIDSNPVTSPPRDLIEGAHQITYGVVDPAGNGETCSFTLTTRVVRCPVLLVPDHGNIHLNYGHGDCLGGAVYGSSCGYSCDVGYQLSTGDGSFLRNCLWNSPNDVIGYWNAHQPSCLIKNCTVPSVLNGHSNDCHAGAVGYGTTCEFECDRGYTTPMAGDEVHRSCQADTSWSGGDFHCSVVITCPAHFSLDFGHVEPPECANDATVRFDTQCEYSCGSGFIMQGPVVIQCNPDGTWNDVRQPHCQDIQNPVFTVACPVQLSVDAERGTTYAHLNLDPPNAQDNSGSVNVSRIGPSDTIFHEGSTTVSYLASDASGNEARCDVIVTVHVYRCPPPEAPVDGSIANCSDLFYGSRCSFVCDIGHELIGSETLTCELLQGMLGPNASWNEPFPTCKIRTCPGLQMQPPAIKSGCYNDPPMTEDYGTVCTFTCPYGYQGMGDDTKWCDENGEWSSASFSCERTPCPPLNLPSGMVAVPNSCTVDPRFGDACTLRCSRSGFEVHPQDSSSVTCSGNGRWTKSIMSAACKDIEPPTFTQCPNDFVAHPGPSSTSALVSWMVVAADNDVIGPTVTCDHHSNASMPVGEHHVTCLASDRSGNVEDCSFTVTVEVLHCNTLVPPSFGALDGPCDTSYGSSCQVTCISGYHLNGSRSATCELDGNDMYWQWDSKPHCEANWCPSLILPYMVTVYPKSCTEDARVAVGTVCTFYCTSDLSLVGNITSLTCLIDGQWDQEMEAGSITCEDKSSPVITSCPSVVHAIRTQNWGVEVTFDLPTAQDNFDTYLDVLTDPLDLTSPLNFTVNTACKYTFLDDSLNKADCVFDVIIEDLVEPTFLYCPPDQNITTGQQMTLVTWDEPVIQDIPGDDVLVTCNYDTNQMELPWGENEVVYRATNLKNGFQRDCKFSVYIEPVPCSELHTPNHGALSCDTWMFRRYCSVSCDESYDVPRSSSMHQPTKLYVCGASGLWSPHAYVADCSETRDPRRSNLPSALQYYTGSCDSPTTAADISEAFISILRGSMFRDMCLQEEDCKVENVAVWCGDTGAHNIQMQNSALLRRRKRYIHQKIDQDLELIKVADNSQDENDLQNFGNITAIYFDMVLKNDVGGTRYSGLELESKLLTVAHKVIEEFRLLHNLTLSMTSGDSVIKCDDGYVADHESLKCVACTTGHFYDKVTSECIPCWHGYYQDQQAQMNCLKCPMGQSTERKGSNNSDQCIDLCPEGHFSATGLKPCIKCPRDTFQPMGGQTSCFDCGSDEVTQHSGSISPDQCIQQQI